MCKHECCEAANLFEESFARVRENFRNRNRKRIRMRVLGKSIQIDFLKSTIYRTLFLSMCARTL